MNYREVLNIGLLYGATPDRVGHVWEDTLK